MSKNYGGSAGPELSTSNLTLLAKQRHMPKRLQNLATKVEQQEEERAIARLREGRATKREDKFAATNWRQVSSKRLAGMPKVAQSRYQAYEPASKESSDAQEAAQKRIRQLCGKDKSRIDPLLELLEKQHNMELLGQLKAAEARDRLRHHHSSYNSLRVAEIHHLIASQATALEALRLKSFLPPTEKKIVIPKYLNRQQRKRCEELLEDTGEESILRKH